MGRWRTIVLVGLSAAACGTEPLGLTQAVEVVPEAEGTGSSSGGATEGETEGETVGGSTGDGWGGGEGEDDGSSSEGPVDVPGEPDADPGPDGNTVVSGSRLRRRELTTPSGAVAETELWDSKLAVPCSFERASDGEQRCMPDVYAGVVFADSECTQPVIVSPFSCTENDFRYARRYLDTADCDWTVEVYAAVEGEGPAEMPVFSQWSGECAAEGTMQAVLAQRVPERALVRASFFEQPRTDGMSMRMLVADDGAVWPEAVVDEGRGEPCHPELESGRCVPEAAAWFSHRSPLSEGACEQRVVGVDACDGAILRGRESACDPDSFYEYGDEVDAQDLSELGDDNVCEPTEGFADAYVTLGPVIPFESFPSVQTVTLGEGTVQEQRMLDAAGDSLVTGDRGHRLYDTSLEEYCWPALMADGSIRCLPRAARLPSIPVYADDECSQRVVGGSASVCGETAPPVPYAVEQGSCGAASSVYVLGDKVDSQDFYWPISGCSPAAPIFGETAFFHLGEPLPLEMFTELSYVTDEP